MSPDLATLPAKAPPLTREQALARKRKLAVQRRAARRAAGMCAKCGEHPPRPDKALCTACTEHESKRWHRGQQGPKSRGRAAAAKPPKPKLKSPAKPPAKPKRRLETLPCALCRGAVDVRRAVAQPTGALWPRCVKCAQRVAQSRAGHQARRVRHGRTARRRRDGARAPPVRCRLVADRADVRRRPRRDSRAGARRAGVAGQPSTPFGS